MTARCDSTADGRRCIKQADHLGLHWNDDDGDLRWSDRTADVPDAGRKATAWRWLRCKIAGHTGYSEEWQVDERTNGVRVETLLRRECLTCGRPL